MSAPKTAAATARAVAAVIDHSLLAPALTDAQVEEGCRLARTARVASVCCKPHHARACAAWLAGSGVATGTVIGFPHGSHTTAVKVAETFAALDDGAVELDMVINIGKALAGQWTYVGDEIAAVVALAHAREALVKVIFENCLLTDRQKIRLCRICADLGADFVKTSTGFAGGGATLADVRLMRAHCPPAVRVKAAGGIRCLADLQAFAAAGADRIGATRTADILAECRRRPQQAG